METQNGVVGDRRTAIRVKNVSVAAKIGGIDTDIVINEYKNRIFIILTQYKSIGSLISVSKETAAPEAGGGIIYSVRTLQGREEEDWELACRYLTEQTNLEKQALFSLSLKCCELPTLKAIRDVILECKTW